MLQYALLRRSPQLLRWYRTRLLLDWNRLRDYVPVEGKLLDVGCGVGSLDYEIARTYPRLSVHGIDVDQNSIELAEQYHGLQNITFTCQDLQSVEGTYDCIMFVDVFHHVRPSMYPMLIRQCSRLLASNGYLFIKDISRTHGLVSYMLDRYISGCREIYMQEPYCLASVVSCNLYIEDIEEKFRPPFPHYYIKARPKFSRGN
jgi:2-polyprenyl-3-methyl-5-hydroxy-6-metoxy-1,4-benzoquinol methylase